MRPANEGFRLAIASGKGGTGKTTLATSLALALARAITSPLTLVDCDVEQPNDALIISTGAPRVREVSVPSPGFSDDACLGCGECAAACRFGAIAAVGGKRLFFPDLCHGCGACWEVCTHGGVSRSSRAIGRVFEAPTESHANLHLVWGELDIGEPLAPPIIREAKQIAGAAGGGPQIYDSPPGTACPLVETIRGSDFCLLVTEPTPFGLHDLELAHEVTAVLGVPSALVLNRTGISDPAPVEGFCRSRGLPILLRIPFSMETARVISDGGTLLDVDGAWEARLHRLWLQCRRWAAEPGQAAR